MTAPDPARAQREAADVAASVWVAASAGSGKTKVLTDRVLSLLLGGCVPARVLCLTFTKAAAAEMANRLHERLSLWTTRSDGELMQDLVALTGALPDATKLEEARRLFARVLDTPGGMRIMTIHAFCQSLLRRFPLEAGVPPHFEVMDERSAAEALLAAREEVLAAADDGGDAALAGALAEVTRHVPERGFDELMVQLALERARVQRALAEGHEALAQRVRRLLGVAAGATPDVVIALACARGACDEEGLRAAAGVMLASASVRDRRRGEVLSGWLADPPLRAATFDDYVRVFFTQDGMRRDDLLTRPLAAQRPEVAAALEGEGARLERVLADRGAAALAAASLALMRLGEALLARYEQHKMRQAFLDYDDLVLIALTLLRRPGVAPWVLFKLDGGLDHILVDEAQDTNPEQWEIVQALADEFFAGEGARPMLRTVFAVGDAKQSIFSFQRADPEAFLRMRRHFAERVAAARQGWRSVDLDISFRSTAAVLTAIDAVFGNAAASEGVALDGAPISHRPFRQGHAGLVELWPAVEAEEPSAPEPWRAPLEQRHRREPRARLAAAIAATVKRWLDCAERLAARDRPLRPGDIMVLVRRRGPFVVELVRALKAAGIEVAGVDRMLLTDQLAIQDMMALGQFLLLPEDDLTLATVLKGPLFGLDDELLLELAHGRRGTLWQELRRRAGDDLRFAAAAAELSSLLARSDYAPPFELFAEVLGARGGRRASVARLGAEASDPLDEFLAMALAYERLQVPSLQGFLHWLMAGEAEAKRDLDQRGRDEVRILTVHGAKGLQAPVVFVPDTLQMPTQIPRLLWAEHDLPLWRAHKGVSAPAAETALGAALRRRDAEYRRLLYVALTRAEDRLYVCGWRTRAAPPPGCWYNLVRDGLAMAPGVEAMPFDMRPLLAGDGWVGSGWRLSEPQRAVPRLDDRSASARVPSTPLPGWASAPPAREPTPPRPLAPSRPREADPAALSPIAGGDGLGLLRGRLVHRLLQTLPELPPAARSAAAARFLALPLHGLEKAAQEALAREVLAVLEHPEFAPLFAPGSLAEVPLAGLVGDRGLAGQVDRLVVTPAAVMIVDYKTLRPPPQDEEDVPRAYLEQLAAYAAAVETIFPSRSVRCALLWTEGPRLMPISAARLGRARQ